MCIYYVQKFGVLSRFKLCCIIFKHTDNWNIVTGCEIVLDVIVLILCIASTVLTIKVIRKSYVLAKVSLQPLVFRQSPVPLSPPPPFFPLCLSNSTYLSLHTSLFCAHLGDETVLSHSTKTFAEIHRHSPHLPILAPHQHWQ